MITKEKAASAAAEAYFVISLDKVVTIVLILLSISFLLLLVDERDGKSDVQTTTYRADASQVRCILSDSDNDTDVELEKILNGSGRAAPVSTSTEPRITSPQRSKSKVRKRSVSPSLSTPKKNAEQVYKRHSTYGASSAFSTPRVSQSNEMKPITPSSALQSSMNASLVFDMVTSLSTNDPGVAIAALRSVVVLGREYPSDLLYAELIDRIQSPEAIAYHDAVAIHAALVFAFDKALACSCAVTFPNQWDPFAMALQEVSGNGRVGEDGKLQKDEWWRRNLLVVQFYIYCFQQDMFVCRFRYEMLERATWVDRTRLCSLLLSDSVMTSRSTKARRKSRSISNKFRNNKLIFLAITWGLQLWKCVYDDEGTGTRKRDDAARETATSFLLLEGEQACLATVRLIEMLYLCSDQKVNALQQIQAGLADLRPTTRVKFSQVLQSPTLRTQLASTMIGLSNKSRSKETEWYECNALGRVQQTMNSDPASDLAHTDGYSWSHLDSFGTQKPRNSLMKLLQEITRMQHE
ncbi:hypothetical protein PsorP6_005318 [Peronosclerospora sorghi]|uniref:Uncharacterized protein n=1 Tax=Peronosclerospora sorghi TaxID=230839 RepID=A0ACC0W1V5_9STRA|nr:hypothetical protein PsorP6_005318 [Peronosclerospora sorghi]